MINDDATLKYIDGVATHWYNDGSVAEDVIDLAKTPKKDLVLFLSEACFFITPPHLGDWARATQLLNSFYDVSYSYIKLSEKICDVTLDN